MSTTTAKEIKFFTLATICIAAFALMLNLFSWQFKLMSGGAAGYALIANYLFNLPIGVSLFALNTLIILTAFLIAGYVTGFKAIYGYVSLSFLIDAFANLLRLKQISTTLLKGLFITGTFGLLNGVTIALILITGYSVGGFSTLVPIVNKFKPVPPQKIFLTLDIMLGIITAFTLGLPGALAILVNGITFYYSMQWTLAKFPTRVN